MSNFKKVVSASHVLYVVEKESSIKTIRQMHYLKREQDLKSGILKEVQVTFVNDNGSVYKKSNVKFSLIYFLFRMVSMKAC